jgi:hypothetical protein
VTHNPATLKDRGTPMPSEPDLILYASAALTVATYLAALFV